MITRFLNDNTPAMKLARTIFQGVIGVLIAYSTELVSMLNVSADIRPMIVAIVMAILAPVMAMLKNTDTFDEIEMQNDLGRPENPTIND